MHPCAAVRRFIPVREKRDARLRGFDVYRVRSGRPRANLKIEMAIDQHLDVRKRIAAVNAGRVG
jgi:hypothetical protein